MKIANYLVLFALINILRGQNILPSYINQTPQFSEYSEDGTEVSIFLSTRDSIVFENNISYAIKSFDSSKGRKTEMYIIILNREKAISKTVHLYSNKDISINSTYLDGNNDLYFIMHQGDSIFVENKLIAFNQGNKYFNTYLFKYEIESERIILCKNFIGAWEFGSMSSNSNYLVLATQVVDTVFIDNFRFNPYLNLLHERNILIAKIRKSDFKTVHANIFLCSQDFYVYDVKIDENGFIYCILDCYGNFFLYNNDTFRLKNGNFGNAFIVKLKDDLSVISVNNTTSRVFGISLYKNGSYLVCGDYINNLTLNGSIIHTDALYNSSYVLLFDENGNNIKTKIFSSDKNISINSVNTIANKVLISGQYGGGFFKRDSAIRESQSSNNSCLLFLDDNLEPTNSFFFNGDSSQRILNVNYINNSLNIYGRSYGSILYCNKDSILFKNQPYPYTGKQFLYRVNNYNLDNSNYLRENEYYIYPNPIKLGSKLYLNIPNGLEIFYQVIDYSGRTLFSNKLNYSIDGINVSHLSCGEYVLQIASGKKSAIYKFQIIE